MFFKSPTLREFLGNLGNLGNLRKFGHLGNPNGRQSIKNSDLIGTPGGTRFSFFKDFGV